MSKENRKWIIGIIFIMAIILCIDASGSIINNYGSNSIWKIINNDTIVQNDTSLNVNIGENASTGYKLNVNGNSFVNGSLQVDSLMFKDGVIGIGKPNFILFKKYVFSGNDFGIVFQDDNNTLIFSTNSINITTSNNLNIDSQNVNIEHNLTVSGSINAYGIVPIGTIEDWFGDVYGLPVPDGWQICDGSFITDVNSILYGYQTPDLTDSFIKGGSYSNETGGENFHTLSILEMPSHTHTLTRAAPSGSGTSILPSAAPAIKPYSYPQTNSTGGSSAFDNQPSYYTCIEIMRIK